MIMNPPPYFSRFSLTRLRVWIILLFCSLNSFQKIQGQNRIPDSNGWRKPFKIDSSGFDYSLIQIFGKSTPELEKAIALYAPFIISDHNGEKYVITDYSILSKIVKDKSLYIIGNPELDRNLNEKVPFDNFGSNLFMAIWDLGMKNFSQLKGNERFLDGLNALAKQNLCLYLGRVYRKCHHSYTEKEKKSFWKNSHDFEEVLNDLNSILSLHENKLKNSFKERSEKFNEIDSLGRNGLETNESSLEIQDIIQTLYIPRWKVYRNYIQDCLDNRKKPDIKYINEKMRALEKSWVFQSPPETKPKKIDLEQRASTLFSIYQKYQGINFRVE